MLQAFFDLRIKAKLLIVASITLIIFLIGNILVASKIDGIVSQLEGVTDYDRKIVQNLSWATVSQLEQAVEFERLLAATLRSELGENHGPQIDGIVRKFNEFGAMVDEYLATTEALMVAKSTNSENLEPLRDIKRAHTELNYDAATYISALQNGTYRENNALLDRVTAEQERIGHTLHSLLDKIDKDTTASLAVITENKQTIIPLMSLAFITAALISLGLFYLLANRLADNLRQAITGARDMAQGNYDSRLAASSKDEAGAMIAALNEMRSEVILKMEDERAESLRIKQALDNVSASVMVADPDRNIIYTNKAVVNTLRDAEDDLRKALSNFSVDRLIGTNIDEFHANPHHQRQLLENLSGEYRTKIVVGGRHMALIVNPVHDESGQRIGTVVEWNDMTAQVKIQEELDGIIDAANDGELNRRIDLADKTGFYEQISVGLNTLLDTVSTFVSEMAQIFASMSQGNLNVGITKAYNGEFDAIKNNANNSIAKLTEVMLKIRHAANSVKVSSHEVAQGSDDLSRRTESQASSLEETASSMEEITSTVKQTSDNAVEANKLAEEARGKAEQGGEVVQNAVHAMNEILASSNKINDIISVIDEIAFQTNLLALNAAVEAARAGEQGRGFAVVAAEVRTLSQRSAAAAKEIKDLIRDSVTKVESGSTLVNRSGETLAEIVSAVDSVAAMISDVSTATREQTSGIAQINQAITEMDGVTQQNAALVEQTSAASRSMSEEAENMNRLIAFFQLGGDSTNVHVASGMAAPTGGQSAVSPNGPAIKTYQPQPGNKTGASGGKSGAANFSNDDEEWEDF